MSQHHQGGVYLLPRLCGIEEALSQADNAQAQAAYGFISGVEQYHAAAVYGSAALILPVQQCLGDAAFLLRGAPHQIADGRSHLLHHHGLGFIKEKEIIQ